MIKELIKGIFAIIGYILVMIVVTILCAGLLGKPYAVIMWILAIIYAVVTSHKSKSDIPPESHNDTMTNEDLGYCNRADNIGRFSKWM